MNTFTKIIGNELNHFNKLNNDAKRLVLSYFLYGLGLPLITTFTNAFIWSKSHDFLSVALYNIGNWTILPFVFFVNGVLLQFIRMPKLYFGGLLIMAIAPFIVIILSVTGYLNIFLIGLVFGIGNGLFWSNRTMYTLQSTDINNRSYFYGLTFSIETLTNILLPFVIGWILVFGSTFAYQIFAVLLLCFYLASATAILPLSNHKPPHAFGLLTNTTGKWNTVRLASVVMGLQSGSNFVLPSLLILYLLGNEGILGSISSFSAIIVALAIYQIGKIALTHHRFRIFAIGITILSLGAIIFTLKPEGAGIVIYVIAVNIAANFAWSSYAPLTLDIIDEYTRHDKSQRFKYIVDEEFFLNIGRISGVGLFFILYFFVSKAVALRYVPLILAITQIGMLYFIRKLVGRRNSVI